MKTIVLRLLPLCIALFLAACEDDFAECPAENDVCSGQCTDTRLDRFNCGACGNVCSAGFECVDGACTECPGGECPAGDLYAACFGEGTVVQLESETLDVVGNEASGIDGPQSLAFLGDDYLLVLGSLDQQLHVFDRSRMQRVGSVSVGTAPNQVLVRGTRAWVISSGENTVQVIDLSDPASPATVDEVSLGEGKNPMAGAFDESGTLWISALLTGELIAVDFDGERGTVESVVTLDTTGLEGSPFPTGVAIVGQTVYVTLNNLGGDFLPAGNGRLATWNRETQEKGLIDLGATCTNPGFVAARGAELFVTCTGTYGADDGEVVVFDTAAGEVVRRVATGGSPARISLDPARTGRFYVADASSGALVVVEPDDAIARIEVCPDVELEFVGDVAIAP